MIRTGYEGLECRHRAHASSSSHIRALINIDLCTATTGHRCTMNICMKIWGRVEAQMWDACVTSTMTWSERVDCASGAAAQVRHISENMIIHGKRQAALALVHSRAENRPIHTGFEKAPPLLACNNWHACWHGCLLTFRNVTLGYWSLRLSNTGPIILLQGMVQEASVCHGSCHALHSTVHAPKLTRGRTSSPCSPPPPTVSRKACYEPSSCNVSFSMTDCSPTPAACPKLPFALICLSNSSLFAT